MRRIIICVLLLPAVVFSPEGRGAGRGRPRPPVELTLYPARAPEAKDRYELLPKPDRQNDEDALPLYNKAIDALPKDLDHDQMDKWREVRLDQLPVQEVRSTLHKLKPTLDLLEQAGRCRQCKWSAAKAGVPVSGLLEYRKLAYVLGLQARFQMAQGKYEEAVGTVRSGLVMARHLGSGPTLMQGLNGTAYAALMLKHVEELIQAPDAPSLYWALGALPKPFIDMTRQMELEMGNVDAQYKDPSIRKQMKDILKPGHDRATVIMKRVEQHFAAVRCIEALRLYAASHEGNFADELAEVKEVEVPTDSVTGEPFVYKRRESRAVLEGAAPEGAGRVEGLRYELTLVEGAKGVKTNSKE